MEIKRWDTKEIIIQGEYEDARDCIQKNKNISFYRADLRGVSLWGADLSGVDLREADLRDVNIKGADLREIILMGAKIGEESLKRIPQLNTPTVNEYIRKFNLKKEGEYIYLYKEVNENLESIHSSKKIKYTKGVHEVKFADCDVWMGGSFGITLSPKESKSCVKVKVHIGDIACIPIWGHDSKIRVKKCEVV